MLQFEYYYEPKSIGECIALLKQYGVDGKIIAGGTDIIPKLKSKTIRPKAIISIHKIPGLNEVIIYPGGLTLGAMTRLRDISLNSKLDDDYHVIKEAAGHVSSMQVRNVATIGGNTCNASPGADAVEGLIVMDANVVIEGSNGRREVPLAEFFIGPGQTVLASDEMLIAFKVPVPKPKTGTVYKKYAIRGDTDIAIVGVAASITLANDGKVIQTRLSLAAVAPTPFRIKKVEEVLVGKKITPRLISEAAEITCSSIKPISDQRATAEYRMEMAKVWTRHALEEAFTIAEKK
jgi:carbon-monoxide dehydrogenase medium subunit